MAEALALGWPHRTKYEVDHDADVHAENHERRPQRLLDDREILPSEQIDEYRSPQQDERDGDCDQYEEFCRQLKVTEHQRSTILFELPNVKILPICDAARNIVPETRAVGIFQAVPR